MLHQVFKPTLIVLSISILAWILFRIVNHFLKPGHRISYKKETAWLLFAVYIVFIFCLTLLPVPMTLVDNPNAMDINLVPVINTVKQAMAIFSGHNTFKRLHVIENILGNIILFIPLGIIFYLFLPAHSLKKIILLAAICSLSLELMQLIGRQFGNYRTVDVDDIILNTMGALIGSLICRWLIKLKVDHDQ